MFRVQFSVGSLDSKQLLSICSPNHSRILMNNQTAHSIITDTYDYETCKEIVSNGCVSGVCSQHIYYADTITFFDKYEEEILSLIEDRYGVDTLVELFTQANTSLKQYKNDVVWLFIENVACEVVTEMEEIEYAQDQMIEEYMKPINGYNPPQSMTIHRYSQV